MSRPLVRTLSHFAALVDGIEMTPDLLTGVVTAALMQADVVADELYETVIPELPPAQRAFPSAMAGKIARRDIFDDSFARDLKTLIKQLGGQVGDRIHVYFHGDENHVRQPAQRAHTHGVLVAPVGEAGLHHFQNYGLLF